MFANAYEKASAFTHPLIVSTRSFDGTVECGLGTFVVINSEGWALTVAHLLNTIPAHQQSTKEIDEYKAQAALIERDASLNARQKQRSISHIKTNPTWITSFSIWWGWDGVHAKDFVVFPEANLALAKLEGFEASFVKEYPVFKSLANLRPGTSLCKLGYPFHMLGAKYDEATDAFELAPGTLPVPRFPMDGIFTREIVTGKSNDEKHELKFIETSSPGLRGQSGGPIFDVNGTVWAIQGGTTNFPLGFNAISQKNGKRFEENQFINIGWGIHPEVITGFMSENKVEFQTADY